MFATFLSLLIRDRTCTCGYLCWRGYYGFSILQPLVTCPKFLYSADELLALRNFDVRPAQLVRKCIFHYQLWFPRYDRLQYSTYVNENRTTCSHCNCQTNGRVYQRMVCTAVTDTVTTENCTVSSQTAQFVIPTEDDLSLIQTIIDCQMGFLDKIDNVSGSNIIKKVLHWRSEWVVS